MPRPRNVVTCHVTVPAKTAGNEIPRASAEFRLIYPADATHDAEEAIKEASRWAINEIHRRRLRRK